MLYNSDNTTNSNGSFEQRYKTLLTAFDTIEPSFVMARVGTILEANKAFAARFSMQVEECIGKNAYDFISPLQAADRRKKADEALCTGKAVIFDDVQDGRCKRIMFSPIADSDGMLSQIHMTRHDITDQKKSENEARKLQVVSSVLIEQIPGAFFMLDPEGRYVEWNAYQRDVVVGKPESEMPGTFGLETVHPDDRAFVSERFRCVMETGNEDSAEVRILIHGGPEFCWHKLTAKRIIINDRSFLLGIGTDFTAHKLAEEAKLKMSEDRFKTLFEKHLLVTLVIDAITANIIDANQAAADFYGWSIEELCTMNMMDISTTPPEQAIIEIQKHRLSTKHPFDFQHRIADGSLRDIEAFITKINIEGKELFYAIINDVTLQKQMHVELVAAKEKAEETDRLKSAFLATITHELRTPMNGILGFSELLTNPELSQHESAEYINLIHQSGIRLLTLINEIIDIARIEAGETTIQRVDTNVNKVLQELNTFFKPEIHKKGLRLSCTPGLSDSESIIKTDSAKLTQILTNLVNNALKFTFTGGIDIGYTMQNGMLEFYVKDSGIGIPVAMQQRIFGRFIQVDNSLTRQIEGSGLGLSIAKGYVAMLGGTIRVDSVEGKGTTFTFTLPYNFSGCNEPTMRAPNLIILIAEDDDITRILFKKILKDEAITILYARNGQEAVDLANLHPEIKLVLMDIKMPLLNGYEATRQIKKIRPGLPVIAQTAFTAPEDRDKAIKAGCDAFITKPISKSKLLELMQAMINW